MDKLESMLKNKTAHGLHVIGSSPKTTEISRLSSQNGLKFFHIDCHEIESKKQFLNLAATTMQFPEYFGDNWDAFEECITDLSWCPASGYVVLIENLGRFASEDPDELATAIEIFADAAKLCDEDATPMWVFIRKRKGEAIPGTPEEE